MDKKLISAPNSASITKSTSNKYNFKKEIVRNAQVPLRSSAVKTVNLNVDLIDNVQNFESEKTDLSSNREKCLSQTAKIPSSSQTSNTKKKVKDTSTKTQNQVKQVNIPFSEKKYCGLVDLGSFEAAIAESTAEVAAGHTNKRRVCLPNRDPEPLLSDYYTPKFDNEYVFTISPNPISITKEWNYNPSSVVDILDNINIDNNGSES